MAFATTCGKDAIEVVDRAGFVVNALLFPYLNNAVRMYEHGTASIEDIDTAMCGGLQLPDGSVRPARPRRPRHVRRHPRRALRGVRRSELRAGADAAAQGRRRPTRSQVGPRASYSVLGPGAAGRCDHVRIGERARRHAGRACSSRSDACPVEPPATRWALPSPRTADRDGIAGVGGDLEPGTLLQAYRRGLFPMPFGRRRLAWFSPDPRAIIPLDGLVVSRSLRRSVRRYDVRRDTVVR